MDYANRLLRPGLISCRVLFWWLVKRALIWFQVLSRLVRLVVEKRIFFSRLVYLVATIFVIRFVMLRTTENWLLDVYVTPDDRQSGVPRRYAICFYGPHTSLKHVLPSIKCNVFEPITDQGDTYDVFVHTFLDDVPGEDREEDRLSANEALSLLEPISSRFISSLNDFQTTFSKRTDFLISLEHYADSDTAMEVLRDEHSCTRVWEVMAQFSTTEKILYDGVISLRLDAAYLNDVDIQIKNLQPQVVYFLSNVQSPVASPVNSPVDIGSTMDITINHYKSIALFAYGRFDAMRNYMTSRDVRNYITRIYSFNILQSSSKDIDHSEKHTNKMTAEWHLAVIHERAQVNNRQSRISVIRILPNGIVSPEDVEILNMFIKTKCPNENPELQEPCKAIVENSTSIDVTQVYPLSCQRST